MRITSGNLKGRVIECKIQGELRPSLEKHRQALFNILGNRLDEVRVLDLCSGTGIIGFEAVSRGASFVLCVEKDRKFAEMIRKNIEKIKIPDSTMEVWSQPLESALPRLSGKSFDLIYLDPPFFKDARENTANLYSSSARLIQEHGILSSRGFFVTEFHVSRAPDLEAFGYRREDERIFGAVGLRFWKNENTDRLPS